MSAAIRPFIVEIPQADIDDLHARLARTRWPSGQRGEDWSRGVPADYLRRLVDYWQTGYDWRAHERRLNEFPQFLTEIDGQTVHFLHVRSPEPDALPLIISHGYPGSVAEFTQIIGPLTDPRAHGADPADAFDVVVPSLPGFGFSTPVREPGWEIGRTTAAFAELMSRLGYDRYGAQGGDIGAGITGRLGATQPERVVGIHVNSDSGSLGLAGEQFPVPDDLTDAERERLAVFHDAWREEKGYLVLQDSRPQTIGYALSDSPVGQLAWIAEKFQTWTNPAKKLPEDAVDLDQLLTNISIYWFTGTGATAAGFLYEAAHSDLDWIAPSGVPQGWAVFNSDPLMARIMNPDGSIEHWSEFEAGGHFPAMEEPGLLVDDVRAFFRPLR